MHLSIGGEVTNQWNAAQYDAKHAFVYEKAMGLVDLLAPKAGERILDLGCGTGVLTAEIASRGADILGVDRSEEMISQARKKFPALMFMVLDARQLRFNAEFDAVFSNAVLHWISEAEQVIAGVAQALRPGWTIRGGVRGQGKHPKAGRGVSQGILGAGNAGTRRSEPVVLPERCRICGTAGEARVGSA